MALRPSLICCDPVVTCDVQACVLADEVYENLVYDGHKYASLLLSTIHHHDHTHAIVSRITIPLSKRLTTPTVLPLARFRF